MGVGWCLTPTNRSHVSFQPFPPFQPVSRKIMTPAKKQYLCSVKFMKHLGDKGQNTQVRVDGLFLVLIVAIFSLYMYTIYENP